LLTASENCRTRLVFKTANSYWRANISIGPETLQRVIRTDSSNKAAFFLTSTLGEPFQFKKQFTRALAFAKEAEGIKELDSISDRYRQPLTRLITDLSRETKKKRS